MRDSRAGWGHWATARRLLSKVKLDAAGSVAAGAGAIWVADAYHGLLLRVDPRR
jgi:hypothetical protein